MATSLFTIGNPSRTLFPLLAWLAAAVAVAQPAAEPLPLPPVAAEAADATDQPPPSLMALGVGLAI